MKDGMNEIEAAMELLKIIAGEARTGFINLNSAVEDFDIAA